MSCLDPQKCLETAATYRQQALDAEQSGAANVAAEWRRQADWFSMLAEKGCPAINLDMASLIAEVELSLDNAYSEIEEITSMPTRRALGYLGEAIYALSEAIKNTYHLSGDK